MDGGGHLEPLHQPGEDCNSFEFEFHGSIQPTATTGLVEIRGVAERTSYCYELVVKDAGEFEVTIPEDGSIMGTVTLPDEAQPRRIAEFIALSASEGSAAGLSALSVLFAGVALVDFAATACPKTSPTTPKPSLRSKAPVSTPDRRRPQSGD